MNIVYVILNYRDSKRTAQQVLRCKAFNIFSNIVIVDNDSSDNSIEVLKNLCDSRTFLICSSHNGGFAQGNNIGAKFALYNFNPDYIVFANSDTEFVGDDVYSCIKCLQQHSDLGLVSMRMRNIDGTEGIDAWKYRSYKDYLLSSFWIYRHFNSIDSWVYTSFEEDFQYVDMVRGSFMCFKACALKQADMFDPETFLYYEEEIISYRLRQHGYRVGILSDKWYKHYQIGSNAKINWTLYPYYSKSLLIFLKKYYKISQIQQWIFKLCSKYSIFELHLVEQIKRLLRHG